MFVVVVDDDKDIVHSFYVYISFRPWKGRFFVSIKKRNEKKNEVILVKQRRDRYDEDDGSQIFESVLLSTYISAVSFFTGYNRNSTNIYISFLSSPSFSHFSLSFNTSFVLGDETFSHSLTLIGIFMPFRVLLYIYFSIDLFYNQ